GGERLRQLVVQLARDATLLLLARRGCRRGELAELVLGAAQCLLGRDAIRHIAQDHRVELFTIRLQLRDGGVDRELLAIAAQPGHDASATHPSRAYPGVAEPAHVLAVA